MKSPTISSDADAVLRTAIGMLAGYMHVSPDEAEWELRRAAHLQSEGVMPSDAARIVRAEKVGEPWASWPKDHPRF